MSGSFRVNYDNINADTVQSSVALDNLPRNSGKQHVQY